MIVLGIEQIMAYSSLLHITNKIWLNQCSYLIITKCLLGMV
jgi:hypothetical protein